jgi:hypothetical protein
LHYYIWTSIHPHIHLDKSHGREHGDLPDIPVVTLPTTTLCTHI